MTEKINTLYRPTQEEQSRHNFVGALKLVINTSVEKKISSQYESLVTNKDELEQQPVDRNKLAEAFEQLPAYQLWGCLNYASQNLLWETCGLTTDRVIPTLKQRTTELEKTGKMLGSLTLDTSLVLPAPIDTVEIHRQPGDIFTNRILRSLPPHFFTWAPMKSIRMPRALVIKKNPVRCHQDINLHN